MKSENKSPGPTRGGNSQVPLLEKLRPWMGPLPPPQGHPLTRSEPPMPMLMTSVMDLPEYPFQSPLRTCWQREAHVRSPPSEDKLLLKHIPFASIYLSPDFQALTVAYRVADQ